MSIQLKDHKTLWGRSGNICAFPECKKPLVMNVSENGDISVVGEEAHIVAREANGPRGNSTLTTEQRDKYENLILLCGIHHKVIDDHPDKYTVEVLNEYKHNHENWVKSNLLSDESNQRIDEIYSTYLDEFLIYVDIENYNNWTSWLQSNNGPMLSKEQYVKLRELVRYIKSRVWYKLYLDFENAFINFNNVLVDLLNVFDEYREADESDSMHFRTSKFYRISIWDEQQYHSLLDKYDYHVLLVLDLTLELTRAINYLFDTVRKHLFPNFRIDEGVLLLTGDTTMGFTHETYRVEYHSDERENLPYHGLEKFMTNRKGRDVSFGEGYSRDYFPR